MRSGTIRAIATPPRSSNKTADSPSGLPEKWSTSARNPPLVDQSIRNPVGFSVAMFHFIWNNLLQLYKGHYHIHPPNKRLIGTNGELNWKKRRRGSTGHAKIISADVFMWRNKKISGTVLGVATVIWFLFELLEYHLLTLVCHILIFTLAVLFLWSNASTFINKAPPRIPDVHIPENVLLEFASALRFEINRGLAVLRDIASGKDLKKFLAVIAGLWVASVVGGWFNFLTLVYLLFVLLHTLPVLYEKYEDQVDAYAEKASIELKKHYAVVDEKVLSKIPRGPLKDKKFA